MSVTQEEIKKIAENLAKLTPKNLGNLSSSTNSILWYFELLNEVDTKNVEPTVNVVEKNSVLREDIELEKEIQPSELLACSEQKVVGWQIAVANIMK